MGTRVWRRSAAPLMLVPLLVAATGEQTMTGGEYRASIAKFRADREARLKADDGWLTIAGLYWLKQGENRFGTNPLNDIVLPDGSAPPDVGVFHLDGEQASVTIRDGVTVTLNGKPVVTSALRPGAQDTLAIGSLTMWVHKSGDRLAVRLRDQNSRFRREFTGLSWFDVDESYRVTGSFVPYAKEKPVQVPNILGDLEHYVSPGEVEFTLSGERFRMMPVISGQRLFFIFRDLTSGVETYASARFLYADAPKDGKVVLDFNQAQNPPCAVNPFTTCPLPPPQNRLRVRVEAGEKTYLGGAATASR